MEPQEVGPSYQEVSSWWLGFEFTAWHWLFCFLCDVKDVISSLMYPLSWKELSHPAFLTMIDCYLIKPWAKRNHSPLRLLLPCIFIIVMKKVTNSSNALYYHGPLCKCVEWHCWCCYCVECDCSKIYLEQLYNRKHSDGHSGPKFKVT